MIVGVVIVTLIYYAVLLSVRKPDIFDKKMSLRILKQMMQRKRHRQEMKLRQMMKLGEDVPIIVFRSARETP